MSEQGTLFGTETVDCKRCGHQCQVDAMEGTKAKMLRRAKGPGLCVNCAVHDWLRNTYPPNIILAQSGPRVLLFEHIQQQFTELMRMGSADAKPDEIDWQEIIDNWELPFPNKIKASAANPCDQEELDEIKAGTHPGLGSSGRKTLREIADGMNITSFEQLNELSTGLGDDLKKCVRGHDE